MFKISLTKVYDIELIVLKIPKKEHTKSFCNSKKIKNFFAKFRAENPRRKSAENQGNFYGKSKHQKYIIL